MHAGRHHRDGQGLQPARPRRRRLPDRHEVAVHPAEGDGKPHYVVVNADEGEPGTCRDLPLMMNDPHSLIEGIIIACYAVRANHAFVYIRGEAVHAIRRVTAAVARGARQGLPRRRRPRLAASTATSPCTAAPAPTSAARRRRCSTRSRAARPAAAQAAVPGDQRPLRRADRGQQRRHAGQRALHRAGRRRLVQGDGPGGLARHVASTRCPAGSRTPASTRRRWAPRCANCSSWPAA